MCLQIYLLKKGQARNVKYFNFQANCIQSYFTHKQTLFMLLTNVLQFVDGTPLTFGKPTSILSSPLIKLYNFVVPNQNMLQFSNYVLAYPLGHKQYPPFAKPKMVVRKIYRNTLFLFVIYWIDLTSSLKDVQIFCRFRMQCEFYRCK